MASLASATALTAGAIRHEYRFTTEDFKRISSLIYQRAGICLPPHKSEMVYNRLSRRLRALQLRSFHDYLELLGHDNAEWEQFIGALTTHLTAFSREEHHFPILAKHAGQKACHGRVRLWSCAASTGEEAYSMAITLAEYFGTLCPPVEILATDVDAGVLESAGQGVYPAERVSSLPASMLQRYFLKGNGNNKGLVKIRPELRQLITFRQLNLLDQVWSLPGQFDAIFCRNVIIYFDRSTQRHVLSHCQRYLADDGLLFAGHSENLSHVADLFDACGKTVYRPHLVRPEPVPELSVGMVCYA